MTVPQSAFIDPRPGSVTWRVASAVAAAVQDVRCGSCPFHPIIRQESRACVACTLPCCVPMQCRPCAGRAGYEVSCAVAGRSGRTLENGHGVGQLLLPLPSSARRGGGRIADELSSWRAQAAVHGAVPGAIMRLAGLAQVRPQARPTGGAARPQAARFATYCASPASTLDL